MRHYCHSFLQWHPWDTWFSDGSLRHHAGFFWTCRTFERFPSIFLSLTIWTPLNLYVICVGVGLLRGLNPPGSVQMHSCKTIGLMNFVRQKLEKSWQGGHRAGATWVLQRSKRKLHHTDCFTMLSSDYAHTCIHGKLHGNGNITAFSLAKGRS